MTKFAEISWISLKKTMPHLDLEARAARAALPFEIVEGLDVPCGYERSVKMSAGRMLTNRYLLGLSPANLSHDQLTATLQRMQMPEARIPEFLSHLADANLLFLGFEEDGQKCTYKAYAEFYSRRAVEVENGSTARQLIHIGYKWSPESASLGRVTKYWWQPTLGVADAVQRLMTLAGENPSVSCRFAIDLLRRIGKRVKTLLYMDVEEEDSPRQSFNFNVYDAEICVGEAGDLWRDAARAYQVAFDDFAQTFELIRHRPLGNIAGGIAPGGDDFLTIYFDYSPT